MRGFKKGSKPVKQKLQGGKVAGPGTGTSDDVQAQVAEGSYIMPADSTEQIGDAALEGMGKDVPVNLSNGEFQMPPEQVHAVGVQALDQMKNATHTPVPEQGKGFAPGAQAAGEPELFFANGGPVFSGVDPDELGRGNTPNRGVIPKQPPNFYTDASGNTGRNMPSASREVVPYKGPGTAVATIPQPQPAAAPAPQMPKADYYTNSTGTTGKGFAPSSSTAVTPAGPLTQHAQPAPSAQPARLGLPGPAPQPGPQAEPDYRARAESMARAKRDTAAFQAERAAQDARFNQASQRPPQPQGGNRGAIAAPGKGAGFASAAAALPAAINTYDVAADEQSSKLDVATQAAEGVSRTAATLAGTTAGAQAGAAVGAFGGPFAPLTVPVGAAVGGLAGGAFGYWGAGKAIEAGREFVGTDTQSPIDRVNERQAAQPAPQIQQAQAPVTPTQQPPQQPASIEPAQQPVAQQPAEQAAPLTNNVIREGNSFSGTNISPGFTVNGQPQGNGPPVTGPVADTPSGSPRSAQNQAALDALFERTPEFGQGQRAGAGFQPGGATPQEAGARYTVVGGEADPRKTPEFRAASTPHRGAQNGQLTAAQLSAMRGIVNDQRTDDTSRANNEANNATSLQREAMGQQGANARTAFTEQGQNSRFGQSNQLDQQRLAGDREVQGFQTRAAQRTEKLYQQYENAKPEDRSAMAQQIRDLAGKDTPNRFTVVPGGQGFNADGTAYTLPSSVLNNQTGEFLGQPGAQPGARPAMAVGTRSTKNGKVAVWDGSQWIPQ